MYCTIFPGYLFPHDRQYSIMNRSRDCFFKQNHKNRSTGNVLMFSFTRGFLFESHGYTGHKLLCFYFHNKLVFGTPWNAFQEQIYDN